MVHQKGKCISIVRGACLVGSRFPALARVVVESNDSDCRCFYSAACQLSRCERDCFLPLIFLNRRNPKEDEEQDNENCIEEKLDGGCHHTQGNAWPNSLTFFLSKRQMLRSLFVQYSSFVYFTKWPLNKRGARKYWKDIIGKLWLVLHPRSSISEMIFKI